MVVRHNYDTLDTLVPQAVRVNYKYELEMSSLSPKLKQKSSLVQCVLHERRQPQRQRCNRTGPMASSSSPQNRTSGKNLDLGGGDNPCTSSRSQQNQQQHIITSLFPSIFHGATKTKITTNSQPSKTFSVAQMIFIFTLVFLLPLKPPTQNTFLVSGAVASGASAQDKNIASPSSSQITNNNNGPSATSGGVALLGGVSTCQPYSKRAEIHTQQQECASEMSIKKETRVIIERPPAEHDCEMCAKTVKAHEASHYLALELNTVVLPRADDIDVFTKCHTCLCGVLAIYDGPYLLGEWCYGRFTSKYLTSTSRSLSFVYKPDRDSSNPNASFSLTVKPVTVSHTEIIEVDSLDEGIKSGSITSAGFPRRSYDKFADGYQLWIFVNKRPNTTMRLQVNDIFIKPPEMIGFCQDPINIFHGPPQVSNTWHRMLCDRSYPEDFYFQSPIVSVVFSPNNYGSISEFANGFNMSYTFFDRNVTGHKNLDCGEFNNSAKAYGQGFTLPPGMNKPFGVAGSTSGAAAAATSDIINAGASKGSGGASASSAGAKGAAVSGAGGAANSQVVHSSNLNDLRCHWRLSGDSLAQGYSRYLVTVTNFTVKPVSSNDETMKQLEAESKPVPGSDKWSIVLKESAGLKLFDGIYSTSQVLTAHSAVDSSQPGNKAAFYLSSGSAIRIDVSYPTTTLGTIGFAYAAISPAKEDTDDEPCDVYTEFLCDAVSADRPKVAGLGGEELRRYCIRKELVCDGFVNCVEGDDEDPYGRSKCATSGGGKKRPFDEMGRRDRGMEFGQRVSTPVIISLVFAVVVVLLGTVTIVLITKRFGSNNRGSRRRSSQRGLSHRNPALDDTSSTPGGRSSTSAPESRGGGMDQPGGGGSRSGRSSRHNSGESGGRNDSSAFSGTGTTGSAAGLYGPLPSSQQPVAPQIVEHDPHVTPQPLFIAKMPSQQPPLYDLVVSRRLPSVDEEAELGANNSLSEDDRTFLLQTSNKNSNSNNNHSII